MNIVVIGMGYVGIPCAALLADVPGFHVTGIQRRSEGSGWKTECPRGKTELSCSYTTPGVEYYWWGVN